MLLLTCVRGKRIQFGLQENQLEEVAAAKDAKEVPCLRGSLSKELTATIVLRFNEFDVLSANSGGANPD
jgi:hypothetical protein